MFRHSLYMFTTSTTPTHLLVFNSQASVTSGCSSRLKDFCCTQTMKLVAVNSLACLKHCQLVCLLQSSLNACQLPGDCTVINLVKIRSPQKQIMQIIQWFVSIHITLVLMFCYSPGYSTCSIVKQQLCNFQLPIVDCPVQSSSISNSMMSRKGPSSSVFICFCAFTLQPFLYGRYFFLFNSLLCGNGVDTVNVDTNGLGTRPCLTLVTVILTGENTAYVRRSMYFIY